MPQCRLGGRQAHGDPRGTAPRGIDDANDVENSHTLLTTFHWTNLCFHRHKAQGR
ncbi:MAG: hypothetical protein ACHRHE_11815 [Tepidisphaerales bacterium]